MTYTMFLDKIMLSKHTTQIWILYHSTGRKWQEKELTVVNLILTPVRLQNVLHAAQLHKKHFNQLYKVIFTPFVNLWSRNNRLAKCTIIHKIMPPHKKAILCNYTILIYSYVIIYFYRNANSIYRNSATY